MLATYFVDTTADNLLGTCAADDRSGNAGCTLRLAALEAEANPGPDRIEIDPGTYLLDGGGSIDLSAGQDTEFIGDPLNPAAVVIDGENQFRGFDIFSSLDPALITFQGLTIRNTVANDGSGGGAIVTGGPVSLSLDTVVLENSVADLNQFGSGVSARSSGGAISAGANVTIVNSVLRNNTATNSGGAINYRSSNPDDTFRIENTTISGNSTGDPTLDLGGGFGPGFGNGGGIHVETTGQVVLDNVTISGNSAGDSGGGVYSTGNISLSGTSFTGNDAQGASSGGGGLYLIDGPFSMTGGTFDSNTAIDGGGGFEILGASGTIDSTDFVSNQVTGDGINFEQGGGGIVVIDSTSLAINNVLLDGNSAPAGGGIAAVNSNVTIANSRITNNNATAITAGGGGVGAIGDAPLGFPEFSLAISDSQILGNTTNAEAGGVGAVQLDVQVTRSTVDGNTSLGGRAGGIVLISGALAMPPILRVDSSTISNNRSQGDGGGIAVSLSEIDLTNTTVSSNESVNGSGGGIAYDTPDTETGAQIFYSTVADNIAAGSGSNIVAQGAPIFIEGSLFTGGTGAAQPGVFSSVGGNLDDGNSMGFAGPGDLTNVNPLIGPLQDNGGPVFTRALLTGSPAIDAATSNALATDARGSARPQNGDAIGLSINDIGAFEAEGLDSPVLRFVDVFVDEDAGSVSVSAILDSDAVGAFTVDIATGDKLAIAPDDYTATTTTLSFAGTAGEIQTFAVPIVDDSVVEATEDFSLSFTGSSDASIDLSDTGTIQIVDNDQALLSITDSSASEDGDTVTFTVTLSGQVDTSFTVDAKAIEDTMQATAGVDFLASGETLVFSGTDGESVSYNVTVLDDTVAESDETFTVELTNVQASGRTVLVNSLQPLSQLNLVTAIDPAGVAEAGAIGVSGNTVFISFQLGDGTEQIQVYDFTDVRTPELADTIITNEGVADFEVAGNRLYAASRLDGVQIYDISDPFSVSLLGIITSTGRANAIDVVGTTVYVATSVNGLEVYDASNAANPALLGQFGTSNPFEDVRVSGTVAFVTDLFGLRALDVSDPDSIPELDAFTDPGDQIIGAGFDLVGDTLYTVTDGFDVTLMRVFDVSRPADLVQLSTFTISTSGFAEDIQVVDGVAHITDEEGNGVIYTVDVSDPTNPIEIDRDGRFPNANQIEITEGFAYLNATPTGPGLSLLGSFAVGTAAGTIVDNDVVSSVANDDSFTVNEDTIDQQLDVLANDNLTNGGTILAVTQPLSGSVSIDPVLAVIDYTPAADFFGIDSFNYTLRDASGNQTQAQVQIDVTFVNDPPAAVDDSTSTSQNSPVTVDVIANDSFGPANEDQMLTLVSAASSQGATVTIDSVAGTVTYNPPANFSGVDEVSYAISDGIDTALGILSVTVTVQPFADAQDDSFTVTEDDPSTELLILQNDTSSSAITVSVDSAQTVGQVTLAQDGQSVFYTPPADFNGTDTFSYSITNSEGVTSNDATVTIIVTAVNDQPTIIVPVDISGHVFCDLNADGVEQSTEVLNEVLVFLDADGDREFDSSEELSTLTDANGDYSFSNVVDRTSSVVVGVPASCLAIPSNPGVVRSTIGAGDLARAIETMDYDGDGDLDLLIASDASDSVTVLANEAGQFSFLESLPFGDRPQNLSTFITSTGTRSIAVAAVGSGQADGEVGLRDLTDSTQRSLAIGNGPIDVVLDDFDEDGIADVVAASFRSDSLSILLGDQDEAVQLTTTFQAHRLDSGDFNADGNRDLVVAGFGFDSGETSIDSTIPGEVVILLGNGMGQFGEPIISEPIESLIDLKTGTVESRLASDLPSRTVDDQDLVYTLSESGQVVLLRLVDGALITAGQASVASGATSIEIASVNRDRPQDLLIANLGSETIDVLVGRGDGSFDLVTQISDVDAPSDLVAGDFNADGFDEIAVTNLFNDVSVDPLNGPDYELPSTVTILKLDVAEAPLVITEGANSTVDFSFQTSDPTGILDVNGDGSITAVDALQVINRVSTLTAESEQVGAISSDPTDVNSDGQTTALDALLVINYLSRQTSDADDAAADPLVAIQELTAKRERLRAIDSAMASLF